MMRTTATMLACLALLPLSAAYPIGPGAPAGLSAAAGPGAGAITLAWGAAQSVTGVTAYLVYRVEADGNLTRVGSTDAANLTFTQTGLPNGATVTHVVRAVDLAGEGPASEPATATTFTTPDAPRDVTAAPGALDTVGQVVVSWAAPASDGGLPVAAYRVHRDGALVAIVAADQTTWTESGLDLARGHVYAVSAVNDAGEGPLGGPACSMASPWPAGVGCGLL